MNKRKNNRGSQAPASANEGGEDPGFANTPGIHRGSGNTSEFMAGRRSLAYELADKGMLNQQKLGMEILFLLPDDFVQFYAELFHRALRLDDQSVMHGRSGGLERAKGETSMVLGSDTRLQAGGSGKKWKNTPMSISSVTALDVKDAVDKGLRDLIHDGKSMLRKREESQGLEGEKGQNRTSRCHGMIRVLDGTGALIRTNTCGRFVKGSWRYCPSCGTELS